MPFIDDDSDRWHDKFDGTDDGNLEDALWPFGPRGTFLVAIACAFFLGVCVMFWLDHFWWRVCG